MTIEIIEERLDTLLKADHSKVLLLTGGWGAGKTYQWKQALKRAATAGRNPRYAYVSLFGLTSLSEVRKRIAEETVAAVKIPGNSGTVGEMIEESGWKLKPFQILKLLPVIPYLGKLEGLANELSFSAVRNAVVCFDDLERGGQGLRLADVFGLASFLKEERNCRVILISNHEKLTAEGKDELLRYQEKVVDETVHFAPTSDEACKIALGTAPDTARSLLRDRIGELGISNIRVISRLNCMVAELAEMFTGQHEQVLAEAIHALALFGAGHFLSADGFPPTAYLMALQNDWSRYFRNAKAEQEQTDHERREAVWAALLDRYQYSQTSPMSAEIGYAVQRGYFDQSKLLPLAQEMSTGFEAQSMKTKYLDAWSKFWHSLNGSGEELLRELYTVTQDAIAVIGPGDLQRVFEVFSQVGQPAVAEELLERFIACNQHRPAIFDQVDGAFRETFSGKFAARMRAESLRHKTPPSLEEALDRIDFEHGWDPEDMQIVSKANSDEIELLLRSTEGRRFRVRLQTFLRIQIKETTEDGKSVSEKALELLKRLASEDSIMAIRMRQYLPQEESEKT